MFRFWPVREAIKPLNFKAQKHPWLHLFVYIR